MSFSPAFGAGLHCSRLLLQLRHGLLRRAHEPVERLPGLNDALLGDVAHFTRNLERSQRSLWHHLFLLRSGDRNLAPLGSLAEFPGPT